MPKPIINIADVILESRPPVFAPSEEVAERFDAKMGLIAPRIGAQKLGYNITAVPPGKSIVDIGSDTISPAHTAQNNASNDAIFEHYP